ncbi:FHA domain-containing protein [Alcaligenes faecalis]|uniref:hypothetical protein n=1 Tax=Alcaligenes faecalis TaxID=511 RepID=UPI001C9AE179|nr:hypothetical protein [Alcaligenes faecalis]MBY6310181.1 hypothetical protein [Alcaligenes faecalis]MBY6318193.1 hypothetical protein [Alcaligenes faecalis]MBY6392275.1 hypothetical protein [Alcaligenes faecalis]
MSTAIDWRLQAESGGAPRPVPEPGLVCGSWTQADLVLPDNNQTPPVLSYLRRQQDVLTIQRASADGQVAVNGIELVLAQVKTLQNGDRLTLGEMHYRVESGVSPVTQDETPLATAPAADPFADLHVPGMVPVGGPMPDPSDKHPFDTTAKPARSPSTDSTIPAASWLPELGRAPEWVSTLSDKENEFDLLQGMRQA